MSALQLKLQSELHNFVSAKQTNNFTCSYKFCYTGQYAISTNMKFLSLRCTIGCLFLNFMCHSKLKMAGVCVSICI